MGSMQNAVSTIPKSVTFGLYSAEEIRKLSVIEITNPVSFNALGHPSTGGLYDPHMGPWSEKGDPCATCHLGPFYCPGHMGHLELPLPTFHPLFQRILISILKISCPSCKRLLCKDSIKAMLVGQMDLLDNGLITEAQKLAESIHVDDEDKETVEDLLDGGKPKKQKKTKTTASNQQRESMVKEQIENLIQELKRDNSGHTGTETRLTESLRQLFVKTFLGRISSLTSCASCKGGWKKIIFYKSRIVYVLKQGTASTAVGGHEMTENLNDLETTLNEEDGEEDPGKFTSKNKKKPALSNAMPTMYLTPNDAMEHLRELWRHDGDVLADLFPVLKEAKCENPTDVFFLQVLPICPPKFRPVNFSGGTLKENAQSVLLRKVVEDTYLVKAVLYAYKDKDAVLTNEAQRMIQSVSGATMLDKLQTVWLQLQADVDATVDASGKKELAGGVGFKQLIEKKEGLFRMNMMGKRVNFAARSVITPDPNIGVEEIGIPEVFAKKLTYPTPVTLWNYRELRQMVCNGPDVHPGAVAVEGENGRVIRLSSTDPLQREAAAKILLPPTEKFSTSKDLFRPKIVHRHLRTGDVMLLNRQPSLHKPSIMAHKARVLPGEKTLRLHYSNCKSYNADFDGDEMNAHFPQSELGRSEAYNIVAVPHQYLVPKDGTPLSGLIQDHIVSAVRLTKRGKFFNRADYQQLVYIALGSKGGTTKLLPPTLIKPVTLWSGKQIISTVVINLAPPDKPPISLFSKAKTSVKDWQTEPPRKWKAGGTPLESANAMTESEVIFRQGELICGVLDKMQHGATSFSLVHTFYELYGGEYSSKLLSAFGRLFTAFLQLEGFTLGVKDILLTPEADERRREILKRAETVGDVAAARAVGLDPEALKRGDIDRSELVKRMAEAHLSKTPLKRMTLDREYKVLVDEITNDVNRTCTPGGLLLRFPENNLALMVQSGAKGSTVNSMQISCLLGQIELEGKRPPLMISGRSLPSFIPYETSPRAGGFVAGRFMTGIRPQEFFIHCMAGREGLIDTAVKTSRSGYLQRCLIKHLEGLGVAYDHTVRDSDGTVIQFFYGEDGLDVCRSQYLSSSGLPIIIQNKDCLTNETKESSEEDKPGIKGLQKSIKRWKKKYVDLGAKKRTSPFAAFSSSFELPEEEPADAKTRPGRSAVVDRIEAQWRRMDQSERRKYEKKAARAPAPVSSVYPMMSHENVLTEGLENLVDKFIKSTPCEISRSELVSLVYKKAVKGICEPGEPVGLLAAQSVGEPSTQMTLNTFHFAGRGEMNVTLGIPRLREVLMVASANIQTPSMDIPLKEKGDLGLKQAEKLRLLLSRVTLADVLERVDVTERLVVRGQRKRLYVLRFEFLPHSSYKDRFCVKPSHLLRYFETHFVHKILLPNMRKEADAQAAQGLFTAVSASRARATRTAAASEEDDGEVNNRPDDESAGNSMRPDDDAQVDDESDLEGGNDADTEASRMRARHDDEHEYEEANEVISAAQPEVDQDEDYDPAAADDEGFEELFDEEKRDSQGEEDKEKGKEEEEQAVTSLRPPKVAKTKSVSNEVALERRLKLLDKDPWIADYEFDMKKQRWCQLTVAVSLNVQKVDLSGPLRQWAESAVVHQVPNIKRAFVVPPKNEGGDVVIKTDGINIKAMFAHSDLLDVNRLYCNDIHAIARQYGIEAASRVVVNEVRNVFQVYGITVDPRHLSLIASYMTCSGEYRPFNRYGMAECASPLQQISFETATNFLRNATLQSKTDPLESPSARLVLGLPVKTGTGCFELLRKLY